MSRYVDADAFIKEIVKIQDLRRLSTATIGEALDRTPTADVVELKRGKWLKYKCSICGFEPYNPSGLETFNYCSNCGAEMKND